MKGLEFQPFFIAVIGKGISAFSVYLQKKQQWLKLSL